MTPLVFLAIAVVFTLAGVVKGIVGLGLPTISMALLALLMAPAEAAAWLVLPTLVTNLWQLQPWRTIGPMVRRLWGMQAGLLAGTWLTAWALGAPAGAWASIALGLALIVYAIWGLLAAQVRVPPRSEKWLGPVIGATTGVVTAATGVFALPGVPYLQALGLQRDELIQAMGIAFTVCAIALAGGLLINGSFSAHAATFSIPMVLPALFGMHLGTRLRKVMPANTFRICFLVGLALLGVYQAAKGLLA